MSSILTAVLAFIVVVGLLITVHEFGHYAVARLFKVRVLRFSIGFGPILTAWRWGHTQFTVCLIPLGGFVRMLDEREAAVAAADRAYAFNQQSVWVRMAIVAAGPLINFLFAIVLYFGLYWVGIQAVVPYIEQVIEASPADLAQIKPQQQILAIDGQPMETGLAVSMAILSRLGESGQLALTLKDQHGVVHEQSIDLSQWQVTERGDNPLDKLGLVLGLPPLPAILGELVPTGAAAGAGLQAGDTVTAINQQPINHWRELVTVIQAHPQQNLLFTVKRDGRVLNLAVEPALITSQQGDAQGFIGAQLSQQAFSEQWITTVRHGPLTALLEAVEQTGQLSLLTVQMLYNMLVGEAKLHNLSGPITIAKGAGQSVENGLANTVAFIALISISLGVVNLLPIPMLDGGHLLFYLVEAIRKQPLSLRTQQLGFAIGSALLLVLMAFAIVNDLINLALLPA